MYTIKLSTFEGPLDLLLELIEGRKMEITQISLAQVTDQFLEYLRNNEDKITADSLASFLVIAAKLILIKSRALLPFLELTKEEEEDIVDLEQQLKEYQRFREAGKALGELFDKKNIGISRKYKEVATSMFYPPQDITVEVLADIFNRIISEQPVIPELPKDILKSKISVEDKIKEIVELVKKRIEVAFHSLVKPHQGKEHVIVNFLAMLELSRQKLVTIRQQETFGEIVLLKPESSFRFKKINP